MYQICAQLHYSRAVCGLGAGDNVTQLVGLCRKDLKNWEGTHVAAKPSIPLRIGTNLKVDFFESLDPPR